MPAIGALPCCCKVTEGGIDHAPRINIKEAAHRLVDQLAEDATWDDLMRKAYERQAIEAGLADSEAGRVTEVEAVRRRYGLTE